MFLQRQDLDAVLTDQLHNGRCIGLAILGVQAPDLHRNSDRSRGQFHGLPGVQRKKPEQLDRQQGRRRDDDPNPPPHHSEEQRHGSRDDKPWSERQQLDHRQGPLDRNRAEQ
jgi:hypothetical protein